jgi:hypothetical protein
MNHAALLASIFLRPALPPALLAVIASGLVCLAVISYRRTISANGAERGTRIAKAALLAMRVIAILALTSLLLGPSTIPPTAEREQKAKVTVLVDMSESMGTADCAGRSRFEAMSERWLERSWLDRLAATAEVDFRLVGERSEPVGRTAIEGLPASVAVSKQSKLLAALTDAIGGTSEALETSDQGPDRVLLLSDGRDTSGESPLPTAELAKSRGVPIDTACFGAAVLRRDIALQAAAAQEFLFAGEEGALVVRLHQTGLPLAEVNVDVSVIGPDGAAVGPTASHVVDLRGRTSAETMIPIRHEEPGQFQYVLRVAERPEEVDGTNNVQTLFVDVSKAKARVLLLEGQPSWDMKFIAQALRRDPRVELTQISRLSETRLEVITSGETNDDRPKRPTKKVEGSGREAAALLLKPDALASFDVFILGRDLQRLCTPEVVAAIRDRVQERGAAVVFARGAAYAPSADSYATALGPLEPVIFARQAAPLKSVRIALAPSAVTVPWLSADRLGVDLAASADPLGPWPILHRVESVKPGTIVLARGVAGGAAVAGEADDQNPPAIVTMRAGRGLAIGLLGEGLWKWALVDRDRERFTGVYERCMQGLVRWAASGGDNRPGQEITLRVSTQSAKLEASIGVEVALERVVEPMPTSASLIGPDGSIEQLPLVASKRSPLLLEASFRPERIGVHTVRLDAPGLEPARQERFVSVYDPSVERINTSADPLGMRALAERSGGRVFAPDEAETYPEHVHRHRFSMIASQEATWVWNRFPILLMLCTWLGLEWILRRRAGLP